MALNVLERVVVFRATWPHAAEYGSSLVFVFVRSFVGVFLGEQMDGWVSILARNRAH